MELTIAQTLQQGVASHTEGRFQEAEHLYRTILESQPLHPDANHNLGVLEVSFNKVIEALPLFKNALEANPKIEQFWLSYIDALIKEKQFDNAKQTLEQGKKQGVSREKLYVLESQLAIRHYNLGIKQQEQGRLDEAEASYTEAVTLKFDFAEAHNNLGITLQELNRLEEAEASYTQAIAFKPDYAEAQSNLGNIFKEMGFLDKAEASYSQAIALKPNYAEAYNNLGIIFKQQGRLDKAEASYRQAIMIKPQYFEAHFNLGITLQEQGRLDVAEKSYRQMLALNPDNADAYYNLGITLQEQGRLDEAEASYTQAIVLKPDFSKAHDNLLKCLYLDDKRALFFDELDYLINQNKANAVIGSLTSRSELKYGLKKPNLFCREPLKYVLHVDLNTQYNFEETFVEKVRSILNKNKISNRKQPLLFNGYQTSGNLFDIENSFTEKIQKAIRLEIEKYRINFKNSKEGFIKKWPNEYDLYGWLISMKSGGELQPHIHEQGWISGSVYINVPSNLKADSGKLVVSLGLEKDATDNRTNKKIIINVVTGSLVLFPGSLTHYTIPFEAEEERIVLAFDVIEK